MMDHLKKLCALEGVSGCEVPVRRYILNALKGSPAEITTEVDALGNIIARIKGRNPAAKTVLFAAHMDEVGLIITGVTDEGYLRFAPVGGLESRVIYGRRVLVNGHPGVIGGKAVHLCSKEEKGQVPDLDKLLIDLGTDSREEAEKIAAPGERAVFDSAYTKLENGLIKARALDDRAGCALLLGLTDEVPEYDVVLAFTVQEEIGARGAKAVAFTVRPDIALAVDATTAADTAGVPAEKQVCRVFGGPVVSFMDRSTLYDQALYERIRETAKEIGVKSQTKTVIAGGNDASSLQRAAGGARVAAVSLPCRYIHSPSCVLAKKDIADTLALLKALVNRLPAPDPEDQAI